MRTELGKHQLQITHFEPDVFSALSYLDQERRLTPHAPVMCVLLWKNSLSLAVYNNNMVSMVRTIMTNQPSEDSSSQEEHIPADITENVEADTEPPELTFYTESDDSGTSLLADFNLSIASEDSSPAFEMQPASSDTTELPEKEINIPPSQSYDFSWKKYLAEINLEIMRTRDYYSSVLKGGTIESIIIGGCENNWDQLRDTLTLSSEFKVEQLFPHQTSLPCQPLLAAVGQGTLSGRS
ncbi:MAG: hypothetical protein H8E41_10505 [Desulfobulbaceae bacterium]|uniref:Uncharacterized protein n=1 Tax=Candidatus Desulfobia pelagia TaxID=2841692 RepID=A0A8J6NFF0_9BACT|nr:hypothetical protein [Candidatus Desulfobia pelagia]